MTDIPAQGEPAHAAIFRGEAAAREKRAKLEALAQTTRSAVRDLNSAMHALSAHGFDVTLELTPGKAKIRQSDVRKTGTVTAISNMQIARVIKDEPGKRYVVIEL